MSATRTFTPLTGGGTGNAYQAGDKWGYQTAEKVREGVDVANYSGLQVTLGGSEHIGVVASSNETVPGYVEHTLNGDSYGGMTVEAVVFYRTAAAGTSVTVRVRNTTGSSNAALGTTSTSTSVVKEVLTLTLTSGDKVYRLEITGSNTSAPVFGWGYLRFRKVPA